MKNINDFNEIDFKMFSVWEYVSNPDSPDGFSLTPVKESPISNLVNCVVFSEIFFANGEKYWAMLSNVFLHNLDLTKKTLTISIFKNNKWYVLADWDNQKKAFAEDWLSELKFDFSVDELDVFPIYYDLENANSSLGIKLSGHFFWQRLLQQ
jgi:hypothetical protein